MGYSRGAGLCLINCVRETGSDGAAPFAPGTWSRPRRKLRARQLQAALASSAVITRPVVGQGLRGEPAPVSRHRP